MFEIKHDEKLLSFSISRENIRFGDGNRILFWIDRELGVLQRGRQEFIPIDSIDRFHLSEKDCTLYCVLGKSNIPLYESDEEERSRLEEAIEDLMRYCDL